MGFLRALLPQVAVRRTLSPEGTPIWEFHLTARPARGVPAARHEAPGGAGRQALAAEARRRGAVRLVSSRGVQIGDDTLWFDEFHYGLSRAEVPVTGGRRRADVAAALVALAADPGDESLNHQVLACLGATGFEARTDRAVTAAQVVGEGAGRCLDGVFVWRAEGVRGVVTYIVTPDPWVRELLKADPGLVRAVVRAACPQPDDILGDLESGLREAITRLGVLGAATHPAGSRAGRGHDQVVLEVAPQSRPELDLAGRLGDRPTLDHSGRDHAALDRPAHERSEAQRALSQELAELARKLGTASVRPATGELTPMPEDRIGPAREAG
jgi:hypothetical protein